MKPRLYLETTIPSYLTAWPSRDLIIAGHQQVTREWWRSRRDAFDIFISPFVLDEAGAGDSDAAVQRLRMIDFLPVLTVTEQVEALAWRLLDSRIIPAKAALDASHIAISAVHRLDYTHDLELQTSGQCPAQTAGRTGAPGCGIRLSHDLHA